jgi:sugar/nucleoside kinase (ribokinase family)
MYKLVVYGNIIYDLIYNNGIRTYSIGGIGNIIDLLQEQNKYLVVAKTNKYEQEFNRINHKFINDLAPNSRAYIYINEDGHKSSNVIWGCDCNVEIDTTIKSQWFHFMYLDRLNKITTKQLIKLNGIKSADLCLKPKDKITKSLIKMLDVLDYLIISENEYNLLTKYIADISTNILLHSKNEMWLLFKDGSQIHFEHKGLINNNKDIVGAGDKFAIHFILNRLNDYSNIQSAIMAQEQTIKELNEQTI